MSFPLYLIPLYSYKPGHATTTFFWEQKKDANQICPTLKPSGRYTTARSKPFAKTSGARKPSGCFAMSRANLASHSWKTFWVEVKALGMTPKSRSRQLLIHPSILVIIVVSIFVPLWALNRSFKRKSKMYSWLPTNHPIRCQLTSEWSFKKITRKPCCLMVSEPNH